ncbi:MAG: LytR/AlgR family response regulator transcription factor [Ferruginibacter sp.]
MIRAVIIDDEKRSRQALHQKIVDHCAQVQICGEAADGIAGLALIQKENPDVVFLDIEMPHLNGLQLAEALQGFKGNLVFTTAYNQFAIQAIKFSAFDYLLKPVDIEELKATVSRLELLHQSQSSAFLHQQQLETLLSHLNIHSNQSKQIAINTQDKIHFVEVDQITKLEASSNYTIIYCSDGTKLMASKTLKEFDAILPEAFFVRVHHSTIINIQFMKSFIKSDGGQVLMKDGSYVDISRRKKDELLQRIKHI